MDTLNIGILAHVDAGKTTLTERILFEPASSRRSAASTKARRRPTPWSWSARGITIKSAVVSFQLNDLKVNLIDTPGHADFIAEVERSLRVLDGVVLVVSAVEGVQPQTRRLARAIRAAGLPLLIFVNKIDRSAPAVGGLLGEIAATLGIEVVPMGSVRRPRHEARASLR